MRLIPEHRKETPYMSVPFWVSFQEELCKARSVSGASYLDELGTASLAAHRKTSVHAWGGCINVYIYIYVHVDARQAKT